MVEFAPFQKISKKKLKKKDAKAGSIEEGTETQSLSISPDSLQMIRFFYECESYRNSIFTLSDPEYKRFLENYSCDEEKSMANPETLLGEIEAKTRELIGTLPYAQIIIISL